ncbi:hypothetical protein [Oceanobacillus halotolerans]|uniref:hypothetical protein n=1 Tax=Oceanobacillus halotolerans TaxID=2663380 RepID=UPI0013DB49FD|nr:hypothetical protein [Oceanobacillus halotolerans]
MQKQIKGLLYFYTADIRHSLTVFWTILLAILVVSLTFVYFLERLGDGFFTFSLTGPMYVYCAILGFITVKEAIPFSIKIGATRKNIFISLGIFFFLLSFSMATVGSLLQEAIKGLNQLLNVDIFTFLHISHFLSDVWYSRILIDTSIMFFLLTFMLVVGLIFYRYGLLGGGTFLGILLVIFLVGITQDWFVNFFGEVFLNIDLVFFIQLFGIGVSLYFLSFLLLRRITIVKVR